MRISDWSPDVCSSDLQADIEGYNDVAAVFRSTAEGETGHAHGHLEFLQSGGGDPATNMPIGDNSSNLKSAIAGETHEYTDMYPGMDRTARDEGFDEIANWFETLDRKDVETGKGVARSGDFGGGRSIKK